MGRARLPRTCAHRSSTAAPRNAARVWHAADVFVSPSDNIQETFGLAVIEAMASGLPVVASDWDGYRDLVADGETGFLVPTAIVEGSTVAASVRLLMGELSYDYFLAEVQPGDGRRPARDGRRAGTAGGGSIAPAADGRGRHAAGARAFRVAADHPTVRGTVARARKPAVRRLRIPPRPRKVRGPQGPAAYPAPERTFAGYPTRLVGGSRPARADAGRAQALEASAGDAAGPPCCWASRTRPVPAEGGAGAAPCSVDDLDRFWSQSGVEQGLGRATLAWMLKYDLLRATHANPPAGGPIQ